MKIICYKYFSTSVLSGFHRSTRCFMKWFQRIFFNLSWKRLWNKKKQMKIIHLIQLMLPMFTRRIKTFFSEGGRPRKTLLPPRCTYDYWLYKRIDSTGWYIFCFCYCIVGCTWQPTVHGISFFRFQRHRLRNYCAYASISFVWLEKSNCANFLKLNNDFCFSSPVNYITSSNDL